MPCRIGAFRKVLICGVAALASFGWPTPGWSYDSYLSEQDIREAFFLGAREGGLAPEFREKYARKVRELHEGTCTSEIRLETPFLQIAEYVSSVPNYSAQEAAKTFYDKPMKFRIYLNICYEKEAPAPNAVKIRVLQGKKQVTPISDTRNFYAEPANELSDLAPNGERAKLELKRKRLIPPR